MGGGYYDFDDRNKRAKTLGYRTKSVNDVFEQNKLRQIHESMEPSKALFREARDSENHPNSVPIILGLDVTGSMGRIPHHLVKEGLPNMMADIMERGILDPQILFLAIGDHKTDSYPFQVGQFESADAELDMWLTRTYLEGHGGANNGESYSLAWLFGAKHTETDSWSKRKQKGFIFTIGDEPCHKTLSANVINEIMGQNPETSFSDTELLELAREKYHVYHLNLLDAYQGNTNQTLDYWSDILGECCINVEDSNDVPRIIAEIVANNSPRPDLIAGDGEEIVNVDDDNTDDVEITVNVVNNDPIEKIKDTKIYL